MKKTRMYLMIAFISMFAVIFISSCKKDKDDDNGGNGAVVPVLEENFFFSVDGNTVEFTTTLTGNVWFRNETNESNHDVVDGVVEVTIPISGTYSFTCNVLDAGETVSSDPFDVEIEQDDLSFLNEGFWKALTGGVEGGKKWRLDNFLSAEENQYNKYFSSALKYYEYTGDGDASSWNNGGHNLYAGDWTDWSEHSPDINGPEIGTISFNGATMTATLVMESGIDISSGTVDEFTHTTPVNIEVHTEPYGYKSELQTLYDHTLSDEWATVKFTAPARMPLDKGRVVVGQFTTGGDGTLYNVRIISCTDSALVVAVQRVYEADGSENSARLLYNYICDDYTYTYDDPDVFTPPNPPSKAGTLEDGTYKLAEIPGFYYNWSTAELADTWDALNDYKINMAEWWTLGNPDVTMDNGGLSTEGQARWDAAYGAYTAQTIEVSGSDVTVNYKGINVWGDTPTALIESTVTTTFSVSGGVITFADSISLYTPNASFDKVVELYIIPDIFPTGIAIGQDNINEDERKYETRLQNWIKQ